MIIASTIAKAVERHVTDKALKSKEGEGILNEGWRSVQSFSGGIHTWMIVVGVIVIGIGLIAYSVAGKGQGSHAGREEVRRSYRRELAKQMARQDAEQIKLGNKQRKRWMQW